MVGFHFKFYPNNISQNQKREIAIAIEKSLATNALIQELIIITPEDFLKEQMLWFEGLKDKYLASKKSSDNLVNFKLTHWGHSKIVALALKHPVIGKHYFPELFSSGVGTLKLSKASIDGTSSAWLPSKHQINGFYQVNTSPQLSSDPIFDIHFKNSSPDLQLLTKIEIRIDEIWTKLRGIPPNQFLHSSGTLKFEIDFKKPINTLEFPEPLIFPANLPKRFKLLLKNFTKNCPGNNVRLQFYFFFDEETISTSHFYLAF